jgi:hypothetical protein
MDSSVAYTLTVLLVMLNIHIVAPVVIVLVKKIFTFGS